MKRNAIFYDCASEQAKFYELKPKVSAGSAMTVFSLRLNAGELAQSAIPLRGVRYPRFMVKVGVHTPLILMPRTWVIPPWFSGQSKDFEHPSVVALAGTPRERTGRHEAFRQRSSSPYAVVPPRDAGFRFASPEQLAAPLPFGQSPGLVTVGLEAQPSPSRVLFGKFNCPHHTVTVSKVPGFFW